MCVRVYLYICKYINVYIYLCMCVCSHIYSCVCVWIYLCTCIYFCAVTGCTRSDRWLRWMDGERENTVVSTQLDDQVAQTRDIYKMFRAERYFGVRRKPSCWQRACNSFAIYVAHSISFQTFLYRYLKLS